LTVTRHDLPAILGGSPAVPKHAQAVWPEVTGADRDAVMAVLERGVFTGAGTREVQGLADDYAAYVGAPFCLTFNSGTAGLHACTVASRLRPGDEILVPAFGYMASAMAPAFHGVRPVFCDVELDTFGLDVQDAEARMSERTRAIMAVHLHGLPCDLAAIGDLSVAHDVRVIEDFSQAHGAKFDGVKVGNFGVCGAGSLNATKNLSGGEGGLFVTHDEQAYTIARRLRYLGEDLPDPEPSGGRRYWSHGLGWNYRGQELPAAFARAQLQRLDHYNAVADANARRLTAGLSTIPGLILPVVPEGRTSIWYVYRVRVDADRLGYEGDAVDLRDRLIAALLAEGVGASVWQHHPLPAHPVFRRPVQPWQPDIDRLPLARWDPAEFPNATSLCDSSFVLSGFPHPLAVQAPDTMDGYVQAVAKVLDRLDEILEMPFDVPEATLAARALAAAPS
jgi:perosamine synthetase